MNESARVDSCVIGAGVVGLAVARQLALSGQEVLVVEKGPGFGEGISSRNSEVIHAGIYYPTDSLKAKLCVRGKQLLYDYCERFNVEHHRLGKLIVATNDNETAQLERIRQQAASNGVTDLTYVSKQTLSIEEPNLTAASALLSPSTGIIGSHQLMTAFLGELEGNDGSLALNARVKRIVAEDNGFEIVCDIEGSSYAFGCRHLVNAAGLSAQSVASLIDGFGDYSIPQLYLCKGNYFLYQGASPFNRLIYPVPDPSGAGLGVHATLDLGGQVKFGPDVEYVDEEDYDVSEDRLLAGVAAIRRYFPGLDTTRLVPGYAGIRPKLQAPGKPAEDFVIQGEETHHIPGLVNLFGIESPGLTSSMAIAETVASRLDVPGS